MNLRLACVSAICATVLVGCASARVQHGTAHGAAAGALVGAAIGAFEGEAGAGALIGAGIGALTGAVAADASERMDREYMRNYPPPAYPPARRVDPAPPERGHWELHVRRGPDGERYEERVWVPDP